MSLTPHCVVRDDVVNEIKRFERINVILRDLFSPSPDGGSWVGECALTLRFVFAVKLFAFAMGLTTVGLKGRVFNP